MELQCNELILRSISDQDTEDILRWRNSEDVRKYFIDQKKLEKEEHENWLRQKVGTGRVIQFMILEKENRHAIGTVYLQNIDDLNQKAEYGIFIGESSLTGKGFGTAAAKLLIKYAFEERKLHKLYLRVYENNYRAIASYEKAGFQKEALLKDDVFVNGRFHNIVLMGVVNERVCINEDIVCDSLF